MQERFDITVTAMDGKQVFRKTGIVPVNSFAGVTLEKITGKGIYIVTITSLKGIKTEKLILGY